MPLLEVLPPSLARLESDPVLIPLPGLRVSMGAEFSATGEDVEKAGGYQVTASRGLSRPALETS